jgi:hypothetical protein
MEPSGRNQWQPVATAMAAETRFATRPKPATRMVIRALSAWVSGLGDWSAAGRAGC